LQWRRRKVHHAVGKPRQAGQSLFLIQISCQRTNPLATQNSRTGWAGGQCEVTHARVGLAHQAHTDITTTYNQYTLATKTAGQCAQWGLI
jgi:hypothetical protein